VLLACRSREKAEAAREKLRTATGNDAVSVGVVDLGSRASIRQLAASVKRELDALHVLVNNAATFSMRRRTSPDGVELTWATNQLGYFLLTRELLPLLSATPGARVVNVASELARGLDLGDVQFARRRYDGITAYAQSKQANRMFTWALHRRTGGAPAANAVHPGGVATPLVSKGGGLLMRLVGALVGLRGKSPAEGADTPLWLATSPELEGVSGRFWVDRRERPCRFRDPEHEERLWELCESMTS
jgi:NAD(P)-dependent dehydrogenase (short-subunit alcohol dehydrogenase family)